MVKGILISYTYMEQQKLEKRVKEIFERQDFKVEKEGNRLTASKNDEKKIQVFSSEKFSVEEAVEEVEDGFLVFVDEGLAALKDEIDSEVSVLKEQEDEKEYDLPSYEIIGDIVVISELNSGEKEAVEGILEHHPHVKTILLKDEPLSGEFRVGDYRAIYGEETETVHKEFGCRFKVDPTQVYFSERFGTERKRVVDKIEDGEKVLVMFAGVGPFAILAAKEADPERVVAVEKNPAGAKYLKDNIKLNGVEEIVEGIKGDVEDVVPGLKEKFDRIIMPLPEAAQDYLDIAFESAADGATTHYYRFIEDDDWSKVVEEVKSSAKIRGLEFEILGRNVCGERGPSSKRVCLDIEIEK